MILVDSNVLMYAAGAEHPNKAAAVRFLERVIAGEVHAAIDAEVLQEILHRYRALNRWADGRSVYQLARQLIPYVIPVNAEMTDRALDLMDADASISARDAVHAAVAQVCSLEGICTFDLDFERISGARRIAP